MADFTELTPTEQAHFAYLKSRPSNAGVQDMDLVEAARMRASQGYSLPLGSTNPNPESRAGGGTSWVDYVRKGRDLATTGLANIASGLDRTVMGAFGQKQNPLMPQAALDTARDVIPQTGTQAALMGAGGLAGMGWGIAGRGAGLLSRMALPTATGALAEPLEQAVTGGQPGFGDVLKGGAKGAIVGGLTEVARLAQALGARFVASRKATQMEMGAAEGHLKQGGDVLQAYKSEVSPEVQQVLGDNPANIITKRRELEAASSEAFDSMERMVKEKVGAKTIFDVPAAPDQKALNYMTALKTAYPHLSDTELTQAIQAAQASGQLPTSSVKMSLTDLLKAIKTYKKAGDPYGRILEDNLVGELSKPHWAGPDGTSTLGDRYRDAVGQYAKEMDWLKFLEKWGPGTSKSGGGMPQTGVKWQDALDSARDLWLGSQRKGDVGWRMDAVRHPEFQKLLWRGQTPGSRDEEVLNAMFSRHGQSVLHHLMLGGAYGGGAVGGSHTYHMLRLGYEAARAMGVGGGAGSQIMRVGPAAQAAAGPGGFIPSMTGIMTGAQQ